MVQISFSLAGSKKQKKKRGRQNFIAAGCLYCRDGYKEWKPAFRHAAADTVRNTARQAEQGVWPPE